MLYIINKDGKTIETWYIGKSMNEVRKNMAFQQNIINIQAVQATEDELDHILHNFDNLPHHKHRRVIRWFGDHANFIVANL